LAGQDEHGLVKRRAILREGNIGHGDIHQGIAPSAPLARCREAFAEQAMRLAPYWVSNEFPRAFPSIATRAGTNWPPGRFLLSVNRSPIAWTDPHGASLAWIADEA